MGNMWWENRQEVDRLKQEFTEYRKQTNEKLKVLDSLQKEINDIRWYTLVRLLISESGSTTTGQALTDKRQRLILERVKTFIEH